MPPGSAAPLGRPGTSTPPARGSPCAQPAPSEQPGTSGRCQGLWHLRERWARGAVLETRAPARDGDACTPRLNWR